WIAAAGRGVAVLSDGAAEQLAVLEEGAAPAMRVNDGSCDPAGRFWVGSMAYDTTPGAGALYRVDHDGAVSKALTGLTVPNGPAWSRDGDVMYLADSAAGRIDAYPADVERGELGPPRRFAQLEPGLSPDGMTVDDEGCLWTAVWDGAEVRRYRPDGALDRRLPLPTSRPTSCCFGGPGMRRLFVTTAAYGLDDEAAGAVYAFDLDVAGKPATAFGPQ
ncbi:MAG: SMP-30/gluconolactonase/LRE family protein, partial [Stackebrandtia sp.]